MSCEEVAAEFRGSRIYFPSSALESALPGLSLWGPQGLFCLVFCFQMGALRPGVGEGLARHAGMRSWAPGLEQGSGGCR